MQPKTQAKSRNNIWEKLKVKSGSPILTLCVAV